jgi:hypothetical protein
MPATGDAVPCLIRSGALRRATPENRRLVGQRRFAIAAWQLVRSRFVASGCWALLRALGVSLADTRGVVTYLMGDPGSGPAGCVAALHR